MKNNNKKNDLRGDAPVLPVITMMEDQPQTAFAKLIFLHSLKFHHVAKVVLLFDPMIYSVRIYFKGLCDVQNCKA